MDAETVGEELNSFSGGEKITTIRRILFLVESPFNQRDFQRYGIELLLENGFDVEVWDLINILNPHYTKSYMPPDPIDWPGSRILSDKKVALEKIRDLASDTFVINFVGYSPKSFWVYRAISSSQAGYAVHMSNALPSLEMGRNESLFSFYLKRLSKITGKKLFNLMKSLARDRFYRLPFSWRGMKPASLILAGGEQCLKYPCPVDKSTEILWAHTMDYDLYLKERDNPCSERPIAVFLDDYLPFHPDWIRSGTQPPATAESYYPLLSNFFNLLEQRLELKVVIAAHPRSHYEELPDYFGGRECIRGKTIRLVRESRLVLSHASTALSFANLFHKPVIFLTSSDLDKGSYGALIRAMANWFGKNPIWLDGDIAIDWGQELTVDMSHYERYRRAYIKTEQSEDIPFWQIVANRLRKG